MRDMKKTCYGEKKSTQWSIWAVALVIFVILCAAGIKSQAGSPYEETVKCLDAGGSYINGKCVIPEKPAPKPEKKQEQKKKQKKKTQKNTCGVSDKKVCESGKVYKADSCGNPLTLWTECGEGTECKDGACVCVSGYKMKEGQCEKICKANDSRVCKGGDIYWKDSCGNLGSLYERCPENSTCGTNGCDCDDGYDKREGKCEKEEAQIKAQPAGSTGSDSCPTGFAYIAPGEFMMGSPTSEGGRGSDEKQHRVEISSGFCMGKYEATQGEWEAVMGSNPSKFKDCGANCPVEQVSWNDAQEFIRKYNAANGGGYRLPTEAEWEYAARGGTTAAFYTGDITNTNNDCGRDSALEQAGWYCGDSGVNYDGCYDASGWGGPKCGGSHSVGQKEANAWGLYDMLGNVWEWVEDWYGNYPSGTVTDPVGPSSGSDRVLRGGGWFDNARNCRSASRNSVAPGGRYFNLGFRLVRTLP